MKKIKEMLNMTKKEEGDYGGFLSTSTEVHALGIGIYNGFKDFTDWDGLDKKTLEHKDVKKEIHYAKGGYVLGAFLRVALLVVVVILLT